MKALCEPGINASAKVLLAYWCERANAVTRICWPGRALTIKDTGLSQPTFYRAKAELIERGLVADLPDLDGHTERIQVYPNHSQNENGNSQNENPPIRKELFRNSSLNSSENGASAQGLSPKPCKPKGDDDAILAWLAIQSASGGPSGLGVIRDLSGGHEIPLAANKALLWVQNWAEARKANPKPTLADCEKLGRWLAAGGAADLHGPAWQVLARGGNAPNIIAWLDQADRWDGVSDPRARTSSPRAPVAVKSGGAAGQQMPETENMRRYRALKAAKEGTGNETEPT